MITNEVLLLLEVPRESSSNRLIAQAVQKHSEETVRDITSITVQETGKDVAQMPSGLVEAQGGARMDLVEIFHNFPSLVG